MPDEQQGKQRWREIPPSSEDERWLLDNPPPLPPSSAGSPPPLPPSARRQPSEISPPESDQPRDIGARREKSWPPAELPADTTWQQRGPAQRKPIGGNTVLAGVLAIGAIALIVALAMFLGKM